MGLLPMTTMGYKIADTQIDSVTGQKKVRI